MARQKDGQTMSNTIVTDLLLATKANHNAQENWGLDSEACLIMMGIKGSS